MAFTLDLDTLLQNVTDLAAGISGIRTAYNYDEWPDSPPGAYARNQALHLTGLPLDIEYRPIGMDLSEYEFAVPLFCLVATSAQVKRAANWLAPFMGRYPETFRDHLKLSGAIVNGRASLGRGAVVRAIPDWPGFDGNLILRWELRVVTKGGHTNIV